VDLKDVKEVRYGNNSKEFDRYPDEFKKFDASKCFVIFYGNDFKLKTLSVVGKQSIFIIVNIAYCETNLVCIVHIIIFYKAIYDYEGFLNVF
jgi:hypothetical protein